MPNKCIIKNCPSHKQVSPRVSVHRLPKLNDNNEVVRQQWFDNSQFPPGTISEDSFFICGYHFEPDCYERNFKVNILHAIYYFKFTS